MLTYTLKSTTSTDLYNALIAIFHPVGASIQLRTDAEGVNAYAGATYPFTLSAATFA